jgi:hypothetical protein
LGLVLPALSGAAIRTNSSTAQPSAGLAMIPEYPSDPPRRVHPRPTQCRAGMDCAFLAQLVAEHRLEEVEALAVAVDLAYRLAKKAYRL